MNKLWWIVIAVVLVVIIVCGICVYKISINNPDIGNDKCIAGKCFVNQTLINQYPALNNYSSFEIGMANESMNISGKIISYDLNTNNFTYNNQTIVPIEVSSWNNPEHGEGDWGTIYVVDLNDFYLVFSFADAGPRLFGPFNNNNNNQCIQAGQGYNPSLPPMPGDTPKSCCAGLVQLSDCALAANPNLGAPYIDSNGCVNKSMPPSGCGIICSACGNNICESWENKCNCAEDCK